MAEHFARKAFSLAQTAFEPGHPHITTDQSNLALMFKDLGELEAARELLQAAYASLLRKLGHDHPYTQEARENLAAVEAEIGRSG